MADRITIILMTGSHVAAVWEVTPEAQHVAATILFHSCAFFSCHMRFGSFLSCNIVACLLCLSLQLYQTPL